MDEVAEGDPREVALVNARRKAAACAAAPGETVLAVDTLVALDGRVYGKPPDAEAAAATLRTLSGRTHEVVSASCWGRRGGDRDDRCPFRDLDEAWIDWYVAHRRVARGRSGGYAIQGPARDSRARGGRYLNVVGLPLQALLDLAPELARTGSGG